MIWVLLAGDTRNEDGLPDAWPVQESRTEQRSPWVAFGSLAEYLAYREANQPDYDAWVAAKAPAPARNGATVLVASDGSTWGINATGDVVPWP